MLCIAHEQPFVMVNEHKLHTYAAYEHLKRAYTRMCAYAYKYTHCMLFDGYIHTLMITKQ